MPPAGVESAVVHEAAAGIQRQTVGEKTARVPANRPRVIATRDLIDEHLCELEGAIEIEPLGEPRGAQLFE